MGWWHTTTQVNMRSAPFGTVRQVQPAGHNFWVVESRKAGAYTWLKTNRGNWYASAFCAPGKAVKRVPSPCPGHPIGTPWRARRKGLWPTRGYHTGTDWPAPVGAPVIAVRAGRVVQYRDNVLGLVALLYADNGMTYWYAHLHAITHLGPVKAGQKIGEVGFSGTGARGPHLHLERRSGHSAYWGGIDLNPLTW